MLFTCLVNEKIHRKQQRHRDYRAGGQALIVGVLEIVEEKILDHVDRFGRVKTVEQVALTEHLEKTDGVKDKQKFQMGQQVKKLNLAEGPELARAVQLRRLQPARIHPR